MKWIHPDTGIYNVDWFMMTGLSQDIRIFLPRNIYIIIMNIRSGVYNIKPVTMPLSDVNRWKRKYLVFPTDRTKPLAAKRTALRELEV